MVPEVFADEGQLRHRFVEGLEAMLDDPGMGAFILVLANATYDAEVYDALSGRLRSRFPELAGALRETLRDGRTPRDAADDVAVFLRLMAVGFDALPLTRFRQTGPWEVQFNLLRAFRPPRMGASGDTGLFRPFDPGSFHFNKPFLRREILWEGELLGRPGRLLYNKFPFARLHGLLVLNPEDGRPQFLDEDTHLHLWRLAETLGRHLPGLGLAYNSLGAFASVNHQHFQTFVRETHGYPVEAPRWRHNGGDEAYPLDCRRHRGPAEAWRDLAELHRAGVAYNVLYRPGSCYVVPRAMQGRVEPAPWSSGFAWAEVCGAFTTFNGGDYSALADETITEELARLRV